MTENENRPGDVITGPALEAQVSAGATTNDTASLANLTFVNKLSFNELLRALGHGDVNDLHRDQVAVCWKRPGGSFTSELKDLEDAPRFVDMLVESIASGLDIWFGVNPVSRDVTTGRGSVKDVTRLAALYADLDVKPGAFPSIDAAYLHIDDMADILGTRPVAVIHSGHGLQPIWAIDRDSAESLSYPHEATALLQRFGRLVADVAVEAGCKVDSVFDLPRILRTPGTTNNKDPEHPIPTWCAADTGKPVTVEQVRQALDDLDIPQGRVNGARRPSQTWNGEPLDERQKRYLWAVVVNVCTEIAEAPEGRNNALNKGAFSLGQFVAGAGLDQDFAEAVLRHAAEGCGLTSDDGEYSVEATIDSGMNKGMDNPRAVPERENPNPGDPFGVKVDRAAPTTAETSEHLVDFAAADVAFWTQRDILAHICRFARARGASPYAVLGSVLRRAVDKTDPSVQLPPTVGANASVNLFTVPVGRSGQGKDIANGVGRDAVEFVTPDGEVIDDPPSAVGLGSGEGLARMFKGYGDDSPPPHHNVEVPEIGTLGALAVRQGSTLIGELLKAWMGQPIGFTNAQKSTTTAIPAHSYRLCLSVGAQPENADFFLSREKDGLPQRFLWLPTIDPFATPPSDQPVESLPAARVVVPTFPTVITGVPYLIDVPASVKREIQWQRFWVQTGRTDVDPLDGHLMLTRLKVGFGLALLDGRRDITEDDWRIAGQLISVSNEVRADLRSVLSERRKRDNRAKAHARADAQQVMDERQSEDRRSRVWNAMVRKLSKVNTASRRDLQRACDSTIARDFSLVFDEAVDEGHLVIAEGDGNTALYRLSDS